MNETAHPVEPEQGSELSPGEQAALAAEQSALDLAILRAQVDHLTGRVSELVRENVKLKEGV